MNQADDKSQRVIEQFAELKRRLSIFTTLIAVLVLAWIVVAAALADPESGYLLGLPLAWVIGGGVLLVGLIGTALSLKYWRCPACGKYMGGVWFMRHCPRCGVRLRR
jgi:uncharacterized membrane protein (DUF485 family)